MVAAAGDWLKYFFRCLPVLILLVPIGAAHAKGFSVLYTFTGGADGGIPNSVLLADGAGTFYGTMALGSGAVFKVTSNGTETVLYSFQGGSDGDEPLGGVIADKAGNLYGTATSGGNVSDCVVGDGCGAVFEVKPDGTETVLYAFQGGNDGELPSAGVIREEQGTLYGTTSYGGSTGCGGSGCGIVFELAPDGSGSGRGTA
jgi:uncharacterized repeat protein (TIGR03803 family)